MELNQCLEGMLNQKASDLYITVGAPILFRVDGELRAQGEKLTTPQVIDLLDAMMDSERREEFKHTHEANFAIVRDFGRFRVSAFFQRELPGAVIRRIETNIPTFDDLKLPGVLQDLSIAKRGLVLVVGATGSGKSTTMAAMTGYRNTHRSGHILTVEDPIEFVHEHQRCIVTQREVGLDTESYEVALKNSLRQAPDMILIGEIRSRETMQYAMTFAETGHLCMATLHANNANQALERILHLVPQEQKDQLLFDLSMNLKGVIGQQLIRDKNGQGRHGVFEILLNSPRVSDLIRRGELHELKATMGKSQQVGMQTFDQALYQLVIDGKICEQDALHSADSANDLRLMLKTKRGDRYGSGSLDNVQIDMD
ncbi:PilT/PilU family type 4a pilus ATPase [Vibrio aestuarianus]|uniref:Type IV pilus retractation ATPase PilT n=1 Tax=Vibrio aestuarianus TaxID=28171 RepID=A0ABM9FT97_9VIBR|nr:PilT/PilU family type 4a pilus ATPase [Vibrio aestuarianus]MDE1212861.1 PilT/PilU family type 4a pilus ATPase [Vibrio aestuarianus]MDE1217891.1 PilT/PilU family type 4a pilus ATPase [Vibrio aestuarianus]MDE1226435.1 PilT/PilU family type 4a pilus ATPase [Vibrio aestuarianus]MDE1232733.1 PilT/PilU family type 4a pilus ATPase [Vibrio aestuarianus]MDE1257628.1 PilT/PilU family type 4a pilus ATPase [Vibrio aestuarianus]